MDKETQQIRKVIAKKEKVHLELLSNGLEASLVNLETFQEWFASEMTKLGMGVEQFRVSPEELADQPACQKSLREAPSSLQQGTNVLGHLRGEGGSGVLLFGHADKKPETFEYGKDHPHLVEENGRLYGAGIADDVSGLTAMLSALTVIRDLKLVLPGDVIVASILGKQMGIYGTYGLVTKYSPLEGAIYVHPAESGWGLREIKMASCGLLEFIVEVEGKRPDSTDPHQTLFSSTAISAVDKAIKLYHGLLRWAKDANERYPHQELNDLAGQSVALTVGRLISGEDKMAYEIPLHALLQGCVVFPPGVDLEVIQKEFSDAFDRLVCEDAWLSVSHAQLKWGDAIAQGIQAKEDSGFLKMAAKVLSEITGSNPEYYYGHAASDIRYPMLQWGAQAFGVGPKAGDIGLETEWVDREEYLDTIVAIVRMLTEGF